MSHSAASPRNSRSLWASRLRVGAVLATDAAITAGALWIATLLRFDGIIPAPYASTLPAFTLLLVCYRLLALIGFRLHRWSFRFSGLNDAARVFLAGLFGTGMFLATFYLLRDPGPPRSVMVLELLLSSLAMAMLRFSPRLAGSYVTDWRRTREGALRTVIVGAGAAGEMLLRDLQRSSNHPFQVIGFLDDDDAKQDVVLGGKTVMGRIGDLAKVARRHQVEQVLIAIPRLSGERIRELLSMCADLKLSFKILPVSYVYLQDRAAAAAMEDLSPDDLLQRDVINFADSELASGLRGRVALVTGAAGSIGREICAQLLRAQPSTLVMVDMNENEMYLLKRRFEQECLDAENVILEVADIRDERRMRALFERYRPNDVFHAAAHKHVPLMEAAPCEAFKNNVMGTRIVAQAASDSGADRFVFISTDKAVRPTSVMGLSKRVAEEFVRSMNRRSQTSFCAVRFGNVLGSAGSVVPIFRSQIQAGGPVSVTHPEVKRYFMTISEAVALVLQSAYGDYGPLCVLDMGQQIKIVDLARQMITMSGRTPDTEIPIVFTGLRPGEKLYEELLTEEEESTSRVSDKIFAAESRPPADDLHERLDELIAAANAEDVDGALEVASWLVPSYAPTTTGRPEDSATVDPSLATEPEAGHLPQLPRVAES